MLRLKVIHDTVFKLQPVDSATLSDTQKQAISANTEFNVQSHNFAGTHIKVALADQQFQGHNTWFVYQPHVHLLNNGTIVLPASVQLNVPYQSQLDNVENPFGSCNVTSISMCLEYFGVQGKNSNERLEDELQDYCNAHGMDRHAPADLAKLVQLYGCRDDFKTNTTTDEVKQWLLKGNPVVTHGYFTSSGHVVCIIGYNDKGFVIHDPYGEWTPTGYDRNDPSGNDTKGKAVTYSYDMMRQTCMTGGEFWVHFISK